MTTVTRDAPVGLVPARLSLLTPEPDCAIDATYATFEWIAVSGAAAYVFQAAEDKSFERLLFEVSAGNATSLTLFDSFPEDGPPVFVRVRALAGKDEVAVSDVRRVRPVREAPSVVMPGNAGAVQTPQRERTPEPQAASTLPESEELYRNAETSIGVVVGLLVTMLSMIAFFAAVMLLA